MHESVKQLIDTILKETLDFIVSIPSFSFEHWKIALPIYSALIASVIFGFKAKRRR